MAKVLFIVSGATYWVLKDGTRYATGYWAEEFANPYKIVTEAGHDVVVATPNGVTPNVDMMSLRPDMAGGPQGALELEAIIRSAEEMRRPLKLSDVRLEDYDAVYLPGGHGPMADLAFDADAGRLLTAQLLSGRPLFIVCHGPAAMLSTRIRGVSPFKGYRVTCFTNEEEEAVGVFPGQGVQPIHQAADATGRFRRITLPRGPTAARANASNRASCSRTSRSMNTSATIAAIKSGTLNRSRNPPPMCCDCQ